MVQLYCTGCGTVLAVAGRSSVCLLWWPQPVLDVISRQMCLLSNQTLCECCLNVPMCNLSSQCIATACSEPQSWVQVHIEDTNAHVSFSAVSKVHTMMCCVFTAALQLFVDAIRNGSES